MDTRPCRAVSTGQGGKREVGDNMQQRENFASRMGFILVSAGCAIGIGNVWRFPYITGEYGGALFVLLYLFFLVIMGWPVMTMEFSVGRASGKSLGRSLDVLEPKGTKWHNFFYFGMAGNVLLMLYYTTVTGWMLSYVVDMARGVFHKGTSLQTAGDYFNGTLSMPGRQIIWMLIAVGLGLFVVGRGVQAGVEKITKPMMLALLVLIVILAIRSVTLPGAIEGIRFYLIPDLHRSLEKGILEVIYAAMGQAFFTLSIGMGSMLIFGSYIDKKQSLPGESRIIILLDTLVAIMAGFIIFPACFAYGVQPDAGPSLIFITLPEVFSRMSGGRFWGTLFFIFMCFASLSTVIAVIENIIAMAMDRWNWSRRKAILIWGLILIVGSIPCALGFNLLSFIHPLGGSSTIMDIEDFLVSNNILPLGSIVFVYFCCLKKAWGFDNFLKEANTGKGMKMSAKLRPYLLYVLPVLVMGIIIMGYIQMFA